MNLTKCIDFDYEDVPIEEFWNLGDHKENKMHKIHAYPAKFPAFITSKAIKYAEERSVKVNCVSDIFCGCGTTAFEATRSGKNFWGCDINPVATLIAKTKSQTYLEKKLQNNFDKILTAFDTLNVKQKELETVNSRIKYWFNVKQIGDLLRLKKAILKIIPADSKYQNFFFTAFSNILKPTSIWLTKSIKPQVDPNKKPADVIESFNNQFFFMKEANNENDIRVSTKVDIENINFLKKKIHSPFVDLIVTSPPYVTSYEYADLHQLSTLWLGFAYDYRDLRDGTIGSLYHNTNLNEDIKKLNKTGADIVLKLFNQDKRKAHSAAKYFVDIQISVKKAYEMLNDNGMALFVIGNTEYKNVKINNAKHLVESMNSAGFGEIHITRRKISGKILTPYRDAKGKFTTDNNSRKVYADEFIIIGAKQNG